jgi:hypothetical protein
MTTKPPPHHRHHQSLCFDCRQVGRVAQGDRTAPQSRRHRLNPDTPVESYLGSIETTALALGMSAIRTAARNPLDVVRALDALAGKLRRPHPARGKAGRPAGAGTTEFELVISLSTAKALAPSPHGRRISPPKATLGSAGVLVISLSTAKALAASPHGRRISPPNLDFSNISVHRGRESEKDIVLQQFL